MSHENDERRRALDRLENTTAWRQQYPRLDLDLPAMVRTPDHERVPGRVSGLTLRGVQFLTDRRGARVIRPDGYPIAKDEAIEVDLAFQLPAHAGDRQVVTVRCAVRYFRPAEDGRILFVLRFRQFSGDGARRLARFFERSMMPAA